MMLTALASDLARGVLAGEVSAISRMISLAEREMWSVSTELAELYRVGGHARVIGVTGPAGAGKSTLVTALAARFRQEGATVGIVAVDPTSPYSGGSVLGDRIRMQALWDDPGVFIRSMATRGALGGLSRATGDAVMILDAAGTDIVIVETVGVGQDEVEIAQAAHTVIVVSAPGLGDEVQALKAGLLETADVHVVNKADREGANQALADLKLMQALADHRGWVAPVTATCAESGEGVDQVVAVINRHHDWLIESGEMESRCSTIARSRLKSLITVLLHDRLDRPTAGSVIEAAVDSLRRRATDPWTVARAVLAGELRAVTRGAS